MSETHVQALAMEQAARKFEDINRSLDGMLKELMRRLEPLQDRWQGAGGRTFAQVQQAWTRDQRLINDALAQTASALRTSGKAYEQADLDSAHRVGRTSTGGGISLPL